MWMKFQIKCDLNAISIVKKTIEVNCSKGKNTQLHQILGIKPVLETMKKLENDYDWYVGINNTEMDFVISDNPAYAVQAADTTSNQQR